ncbi:MAG: ribosome maturation factor RimP [Burkholderiaceae bacterium]
MSWAQAVERTVAGLGYDLVDTDRTPGGLLRVFIDRVPGDLAGQFITVHDCEKVTRQLQHVLEVEGSAYARLEVSSPGLDRPLKKPADYARFGGHEIELTLKLAFHGRKKFRGVLDRAAASQDDASAGSAKWRLVFGAPAADQVLEFAIDEVREARLVPVLDFKGRRFSKPGSATGTGDANATTPSDDEDDGGRS